MTKRGFGLPSDEGDEYIQSSHHLERIGVAGSTAIHTIDYTDEGILIVYMSDGSKLHYGGVDRATFNRFQRADSKGRFFNLHIRNVYQFLD